jgi:hypothetical protein
MSIPEPGFVVFLAAGAHLADGPPRRAAACAVVAAGLAIAGLRAAATPLPTAFVAVDGALIVVAAALAVAAAAWSWRHRERSWSVLAAASLLIGVVGVAAGPGWVVAGAPLLPLLGAVGVLAVAGYALYSAGRVVRFREDVRATAPPTGQYRAAVGLIAGTVAAGFGPDVGLVIIGVLIATWSAWALRRAAGGSRVPAAPVLTLPLLGAWWLMATIAGPEGLRVEALSLLPMSPTAERLLAPVFLLAGWATAGLWPLHRQVDGVLLAPAGAILLIRIVIPTMPDGLEHWRPLAMPLIAAGAWHAALSGRTPGLALAMAWVGLLGLMPGGRLGAALLLAVALVAELGRLASSSPARRFTLLASGVAAAIGGVLAVEAGLRGEVVYTVLVAAALVAAVGHASGQAITASERSTPEPSR